MKSSFSSKRQGFRIHKTYVLTKLASQTTLWLIAWMEENKPVFWGKAWTYLKELTESFMSTLFKPISTLGEHTKIRNYYVATYLST